MPRRGWWRAPLSRRIACLVVVAVLGCVPALDAEESVGAAPPPIAEVEALKIEKADLQKSLAEARLLALRLTIGNAQWEAAELQRQLGAAQAAREAVIAEAAAAAGVDPKLYELDLAARKWKKRLP